MASTTVQTSEINATPPAVDVRFSVGGKFPKT